MNYENSINGLIEQLKGISNGLMEDEFPKCANVVKKAATALSTLQTENKRLKSLLGESGQDLWSKENQRADRLEAENEKLRDELEQVKRCIEIVEKQRDAAVTDLMSVGKGECWVCTHFRDGGQKCHDCEDGSNWEWRGPKKED